MGNRSLHSTTVRLAVRFGLIALCAAGCWQEIEYNEPIPTVTATAPDTQAGEPESRTTVTAAELPQAAPPSTNESENEARGLADNLPASPAEEPQPTSAAATEATPEVDRYALSPLDSTPDDVPPDALDDAFPVERTISLSTADETINTSTEASTVEPVATAPAPAGPLVANTRRTAWQMGSKLSLAALAHDRGIAAEQVAVWLKEARSAAESLGTSFADLPEPAAAAEARSVSRRVLNYLFLQGQQIGRDLASRHGPEHAALFEVAMKSNLLLVLYEPGSAAAETISVALDRAAPRAKLPATLWQPLMDTLLARANSADVRQTVRQLHADVEHYLSAAVEQ